MPASANIDRMRARLEEGLRGYGGLVVPGYLVDLEHEKCGEFRKLNAQVREKVNAPSSGAVKKVPKKERKHHEQVTSTTITKTTTTRTTKKTEKAPSSSRSGSGMGAGKTVNLKVAAAGGSAGVSKTKAVKKESNIKKSNKEYSYNEDDVDHYHSQQQFLNSTNSTSPQGPLPSYLRQNLPQQTWQTSNTSSASTLGSPPEYAQNSQQPPGRVAGYSGPPRGGGTFGNNSEFGTTTRSPWVPTGDGKFKRSSAPRDGGRRYGYGSGRGVGSSSVSHTPQNQPQHQHQSQYYHQQYQPVQNPGNVGNNNDADNDDVQPDEPPPAYGSWMENDNNKFTGNSGGRSSSGAVGGGGNDDYSDEEGLGVQYEDFDVLGFGGVSGGSMSSAGDEGRSRMGDFQIFGNTGPGDEEDDYDEDEMDEVLEGIIQDAEEQEQEDEEEANRVLQRVTREAEREENKYFVRRGESVTDVDSDGSWDDEDEDSDEDRGIFYKNKLGSDDDEDEDNDEDDDNSERNPDRSMWGSSNQHSYICGYNQHNNIYDYNEDSSDSGSGSEQRKIFTPVCCFERSF